MENGSFTDDFPIKTSIYSGFSIATRMLNNQMVFFFSVSQLQVSAGSSELHKFLCPIRPSNYLYIIWLAVWNIFYF